MAQESDSEAVSCRMQSMHLDYTRHVDSFLQQLKATLYILTALSCAVQQLVVESSQFR